MRSFLLNPVFQLHLAGFHQIYHMATGCLPSAYILTPCSPASTLTCLAGPSWCQHLPGPPPGISSHPCHMPYSACMDFPPLAAVSAPDSALPRQDRCDRFLSPDSLVWSSWGNHLLGAEISAMSLLRMKAWPSWGQQNCTSMLHPT